MREMSDVAFERYAEFLRADPIESILARNLSFLLDDTKLVSAVKLDTSLKNRTENGQIVLGGAPYLLRDDFDGRHWTAGLRVLLAHEVQHDNSSDADALKRVRENAESLFAEQGFRPFVGRILGQRLMNILEDARVNNIICRRFPGYIPMLRFVNYARTDAAIHGGALEEFFSELERFALTGTARDLEADIKERIDKAAISRDCAECETICNELLALLMPRLAAMCRAEDDLSAVFEKLNADLEDYAFSADTRAEQRGDGKDSYLRSHAEAETERKGTPDDGDDADGDKGDSASPGSGDNSKRYGDMNGSLTGSDVKPKASAGTDGREDRGASSSAGRSTNHGQSSSIGIKNDSGSALGKAAAEGPNSVREVIGADFSRRRSAALSELELKQMLSNAAADLLRERRYEKMSAVQTAGIGRLSLDDKFRLGGAYSDVKFEESSIVPSRRRLPPEYAEKARQMHKRLDRILREHDMDPDGKYIGFVLRKWPGIEEKATVFAAGAVYAYLKYGLTPVFLSINFRTDGEASQLVTEHLSIPFHVLGEQMSTGEVIGVLSRMTAVVSMRLHGLIFAAGQGVPLIGVAYDPKVTAFLDYVEQNNYMQFEALNATDLSDLIDSAVALADRGEELRRRTELLNRQEDNNRATAARLLGKE